MASEVRSRYTYQYDNTARVDAQPIVRPEPTRRPARRPEPKTRKKIDVVFGVQLSLCSLILCTSAFMYINSYATLSYKQSQLNELKNQMISIKSEVSDTKAKISETLNLDVIRQRATSELGMREPLPHQVIYFQIPEQSYTTYDKQK